MPQTLARAVDQRVARMWDSHRARFKGWDREVRCLQSVIGCSPTPGNQFYSHQPQGTPRAGWGPGCGQVETPDRASNIGALSF